MGGEDAVQVRIQVGALLYPPLGPDVSLGASADTEGPLGTVTCPCLGLACGPLAPGCPLALQGETQGSFQNAGGAGPAPTQSSSPLPGFPGWTPHLMFSLRINRPPRPPHPLRLALCLAVMPPGPSWVFVAGPFSLNTSMAAPRQQGASRHPWRVDADP